jgi:Skp family chaperone for outer membrane proteins
VWLENTRRRDEKLGAEQFERAYRELIAAVETISEKESIDLVFRFYPTEDAFESERVSDALAQIQARTFLKYPKSIDITSDVMKALNLSE